MRARVGARLGLRLRARHHALDLSVGVGADAVLRPKGLHQGAAHLGSGR